MSNHTSTDSDLGSLTSIDAVLTLSPVIPVVVLDDPADAVPLARALHAGGVPVIEVTLRTAAGLEAITRIATACPEVTVGAGTVTSPAQADAVARASARFVVTPGSAPALLDAVATTGLPVLPGAVTPSELVALIERGQDTVKFFPAEQSGGVGYLRALAGPFPGVRFCPTGGIDAGNAADYLALPSVRCVGGSWLTPASAIREAAWDVIEHRARQAVAHLASLTSHGTD